MYGSVPTGVPRVGIIARRMADADVCDSDGRGSRCGFFLCGYKKTAGGTGISGGGWSRAQPFTQTRVACVRSGSFQRSSAARQPLLLHRLLDYLEAAGALKVQMVELFDSWVNFMDEGAPLCPACYIEVSRQSLTLLMGRQRTSPRVCFACGSQLGAPLES
jgi:hypothetical protein